MKNSLKRWLLLLLTAPIPFTVFGVFTLKWHQKQTDFTKTTQHFIQRQNTVIASDAQTVADKVSRLLMEAFWASKTLPLLRPHPAEWSRFFSIHTANTERWDLTNFTMRTVTTPLFSEISRWTFHGNETIRIRNGRSARLRNLYSCDIRNSCDIELLRSLLAAPDETFQIGHLIRWYTPEGMQDHNDGAALWVGWRAPQGLFLVGLEYQHLKAILQTSIFPYDRRGDLLEGYHNGNYIYLVDSDHNIIAHPKYWHVMGFDRKTGKAVPWMQTDSDDGRLPLNVARYRSGKLRPYFDHLLNTSFASKQVDIFSAINLKGTHRVLATAPILFEEGQFKKSGIFGFVITGCNIDHYDDPKERSAPYY